MPSTAVIAKHPLAIAARRQHGRSHDGLSVGQRRLVVGGIAAGHVFALWAVMQVPAVRAAVHQAAPMFVQLLTAERPQPPVPSPPVPALPTPKTTAAPLIAAAPSPVPTPAPYEVSAPPALPPTRAEPVPAVNPVAAATTPAPPAAPRVIPASALQYLDATPPDYPRASRRLNEAGTVMLRVYIDERGLPASVQVSRSCGHARLDDAAIAAVKQWRFKPYAENGQALAGWAYIPVIFELEN